MENLGTKLVGSASAKNKAHTNTLHNCHYGKTDEFIPFESIKKWQYLFLIHSCGLDKEYIDYYWSRFPLFEAPVNSRNMLTYYKCQKDFLMKRGLCVPKKGWNISYIKLLEDIRIAKVPWVDVDD